MPELTSMNSWTTSQIHATITTVMIPYGAFNQATSTWGARRPSDAQLPIPGPHTVRNKPEHRPMTKESGLQAWAGNTTITDIPPGVACATAMTQSHRQVQQRTINDLHRHPVPSLIPPPGASASWVQIPDNEGDIPDRLRRPDIQSSTTTRSRGCLSHREVTQLGREDSRRRAQGRARSGVYVASKRLLGPVCAHTAPTSQVGLGKCKSHLEDGSHAD